jgi:hypothetical protein
MAHSKSMARTMDAAEFASCQVHLPRFGAADRIVGFDPQTSPDDYATALMAGHLVVAEEFIDTVGKAQRVDVFPDKLVEEKRSAHGVTFGRLLGRGRSSRGGKPSVTHVALKPFNNPGDAVNEMGSYTRLRELGVPTFDPVGVFPAENGDHVVGVTAKNNGLVSLDRHKWVVGRKVDSPESMAQAERNNRQVKAISETLAYIHAHGVYHPDGQIKNYATNASDKVGVIDTEKMIIGRLGDPDASQLAWNDIDKLVKSLVLHNNYDKVSKKGSATVEEEGKIFGVGMLAHLPLQTVRSSIEELIVHPYLGRLEAMLDEATPERAVQIELLYDGLASRFYADETWPQHFIDANKKFS